MNAALLLIALATAVGSWRARRHGWRDSRLWLQPVAGALLAAALQPPSLPVDVATLTVLTPGATAAQQRKLPWRTQQVALPGVVATGQAEPVPNQGPDQVPDLATALRRHPDSRRLRVIGNGLPARDQDAAAGLALQFDAAPEAGIVAVEAPEHARVGTQIQIRGRAAAPALRVALHDPSGAQVDVSAVDGEGRFRVSAIARAAGPVRFELRAVDAADALLDHAAVPLLIEPGEQLAVQYLAGTPDADAKYWRRWAQDAGLLVSYRTWLSDGVALSTDSAPVGLDPLTLTLLAASDLLVIDERAWATLAANEKTALLAAVDGGLGVLLKLTGPLAPEVAAEWAALGIATTPLEAPAAVTLDQRLAMRERAGFTAGPVAIDSTPALTALLRADDGQLLAAWTARGAGRIALWTLLDSYRLVLAGDAGRYGALWSDVIAQISRPVPPSARGPQLPRDSWIGERLSICGLGAAAGLQAPDGTVQTLLVEDSGCAAAWPGAAGWHQLQSGGMTTALYVRAADDAAGLRAARDREATQRLANPTAAEPSPVKQPQPLPRWPFWLGWLLTVSLLWWRERQD